MTGRTSKTLLPVLALAGGLLTGALVGTQYMNPEARSRAEVAQEFEQLPGVRREQLMNRAREFAQKPDAEQARQQNLHAAVESDPELKAKLETYSEWWSNLEPSDKQRLKPNGQFVAEWAETVATVHRETTTTGNEIVFKLPRTSSGGPSSAWPPDTFTFTVSTNTFEEFLDELVPTPVPHDLAERLVGLTAPEELAVVKINWLRNRLLGSGRPGSPRPLPLNDVKDAVWQFLEQAGVEHEIEDADKRYATRDAMMLMAKAAIRYTDLLNEQQTSRDTETLLAIFEGLPESERLGYMKTDGDQASDLLNMKNPDTKNNMLAQDRLELSYWLQSFGRGRGRFGPGRSGNRDSGDQGKSGGPNGRGQGGGRGPDGRGNGGRRSQGGRPPQEHGGGRPPPFDERPRHDD